ncbi:GIY-YIG nuclease family protein [Nocardia spumae]|uniref:GIY-YIG nuclease family protein n=1 Tax=Nocardia spumae TaxID=2887190 RepID=UPI001D1499FD|nr:GIY-YIG nuclease family protein [Nocardia spumae]
MVRPILKPSDAGSRRSELDVCCALACDAEAVIESFQLPMCEFHLIESYRQSLQYIRVQRDMAERGGPISSELPALAEPIKGQFGICPECAHRTLCRDKVEGAVICAFSDCDYSADRDQFDRLCQERIDSASAQDEVVYYIRFGDRVKIGTTTNLAKRLPFIPHDEVMATEPGGIYVERQRHKQFQHLRAKVGHGREWFQLTPELADHIAVMRSRMVA